MGISDSSNPQDDPKGGHLLVGYPVFNYFVHLALPFPFTSPSLVGPAMPWQPSLVPKGTSLQFKPATHIGPSHSTSASLEWRCYPNECFVKQPSLSNLTDGYESMTGEHPQCRKSSVTALRAIQRWVRVGTIVAPVVEFAGVSSCHLRLHS
jgi:hypothetical protein